MTPIQKTCRCIKEVQFDELKFYNRREYQVDIYPLFYKVYNNGGWDDYVFLDENEFLENFELIK